MHTWPLNRTGPISQNFHAIVQSSSIVDGGDSKRNSDGAAASSSNADAGGAQQQQQRQQQQQQRQLSVLTRRTMAVASLDDGQLEYMLARRLTDTSDNQGPFLPRF